MNTLLLALVLTASPLDTRTPKQRQPGRALLRAGGGVLLGGYVLGVVTSLASRPDQGAVGLIPIAGPILATWAPQPGYACQTYGTPGSFGGGLGALLGAGACVASAVFTGLSGVFERTLAVVASAAQVVGLFLLGTGWIVRLPLWTGAKPSAALTIQPTASGVLIVF